MSSKALNSFGHDVPVAAGQLLRTGTEARGVVVAKEFTQAADTLTLDDRSAYAVTNLQKLERTFVFRRGESPSLQARDEVGFAAPEQFETALITWGQIQRVSENELEIADGKDAVLVVIDIRWRMSAAKSHRDAVWSVPVSYCERARRIGDRVVLQVMVQKKLHYGAPK
jgi:hypothetical protein